MELPPEGTSPVEEEPKALMWSLARIWTAVITDAAVKTARLWCLILLMPGMSREATAQESKNRLPAGSKLRVLREYGDSRFYQGDDVLCGAFSPDSKYLAAGTSGRLCKRRTTAWSVGGERLADLDLHSTSLQFSSHAKVLYVLASDGTLHAVEPEGWTSAWSLALPAGKAASMALVDERTLRVLDPEHGLTTVDLKRHTVEESRRVGKYLKGVLSPDGSLVATYAGDRGNRRLLVQEAESGRSVRSLPHEPPEGRVSLAFSRDGKLLAFSGDDGVWLLNIEKGLRRELKGATSPRPMHSPTVNGMRVYYRHENFTSLSFSNQGDILVGATTTDLLYRFALGGEPRMERSSFRGVQGFVFSADDTKGVLLGEGLSFRVRLCGMPGFKPLFTRHGAYASGRVYFSPDRSYFVMLCENYTVRVYSTSTGDVLASFRHNHPINGVVFTPDGKRMVAGDNLHKVVVWRTDSWEKELTVSDHGGCVTAVALGPKGDLLYTGDRQGVLIVRDPVTLKERDRLRISTERNPEIWAIAVSPAHILVGTNEGTVEVFDRGTHERVKVLAAKSRPSDPGGYYIWAVAQSPESGTYCAVSHDGIIYLWDSQTLELLRTIEGEGRTPHRVAYAPGGRYIVTTCRDKGVAVYDRATGDKVLHRTGVACGNVGDVHWQDGELVMTISTEGYTAQRVAIGPRADDPGRKR